MVEFRDWAAFGLVVFGMACTPGPNMVYLLSRSICQGRGAGLVSLGGVGLAFLIYMLLTTAGITAVIMAVPVAYDILRFGGAAYLAWLAWNAVKPGAISPFQVRQLPAHRPARLFGMGLATSLLNPKIAVLYMSLLPQFIRPEHGNVLGQSLLLGSTQIIISVAVNGMVVFAAGGVAAFLAARPTWAKVQRWIMGTVLGGLAVRMAFEARR